MDEQDSPSQLQEAMQPYLDKDYEIVDATDVSAKLFKAKKKMGWWVAVWDTGGYARNRDRTVSFTVTETGEIQITGDTLDKLEADERADKGVKIFRLVILIFFLSIFLLCVVCMFGGMFAA